MAARSGGQRPPAMTDLLKLWKFVPIIISSVATPECRPTFWGFRRKRKSSLFKKSNVQAQKKFQKWFHKFRFRRTSHGAVQISMSLQFVLLTSARFILPIEVYRCIRSFLKRGVVVADSETHPVPVRRAVQAHRRYLQQTFLVSVLRAY